MPPRNLSEDEIKALVTASVRAEIDRERDFLAKTFRAAVWVAGISLTVVAAAAGFFGMEKLADIKKEAMGEAKAEVRQYVRDKVDKDVKKEVDFQYAVALAHSLNAQGISNAPVTISDAQAKILVDMILGTGENEANAELGIRVLGSAIQNNYRPTWWGESVPKLVEAVLEKDAAVRTIQTKISILYLIKRGASLEDWPALANLRRLLIQRDSNLSLVIFELEIERKLQPSDPVELKTLVDLLDSKPGLAALEPEVVSIMVLRYPNSAEAKKWWKDSKGRMGEDILLYCAIANLLMEDVVQLSNNYQRRTEQAIQDSRNASYSLIAQLFHDTEHWDTSWAENRAPLLGYVVNIALSGPTKDGSFTSNMSVSDKAFEGLVDYLVEHDVADLPRSASRLANSIAWLRGHIERFKLQIKRKSVGLSGDVYYKGAVIASLLIIDSMEVTVQNSGGVLLPAVRVRTLLQPGQAPIPLKTEVFDRLENCIFTVTPKYREDEATT